MFVQNPRLWKEEGFVRDETARHPANERHRSDPTNLQNLERGSQRHIFPQYECLLRPTNKTWPHITKTGVFFSKYLSIYHPCEKFKLAVSQ